jgi:hypothetical protein
MSLFQVKVNNTIGTLEPEKRNGKSKNKGQSLIFKE